MPFHSTLWELCLILLHTRHETSLPCFVVTSRGLLLLACVCDNFTCHDSCSCRRVHSSSGMSRGWYLELLAWRRCVIRRPACPIVCCASFYLGLCSLHDAFWGTSVTYSHRRIFNWCFYIVPFYSRIPYNTGYMAVGWAKLSAFYSYSSNCWIANVFVCFSYVMVILNGHANLMSAYLYKTW